MNRQRKREMKKAVKVNAACREEITVTEKVIRFIKCRFEACIDFFSKISFRLKFSLVFPKVLKVSRKEIREKA